MTKSLKMNLFLLVVVSSVSGVALSGCSTVTTASQRGQSTVETKTILPVPAGRGTDENAGVVLAYEFSGEDRPTDSTCRWRMINQTTNESFFLTLNTEEKAAFSPMSPGHYKAVRLGCGINQVWDMSDTFKAGFDVHEGQASSLGHLQFIFKQGELDEVKVISRAPASTVGAGMDSDDPATAVVPDGMHVISGFQN